MLYTCTHMATVGVKGLNNWHTQHRGIATSYEKQSAVKYLNHTICRTTAIHTYTLDTGFASIQLISSNNIRLKSRNQKRQSLILSTLLSDLTSSKVCKQIWCHDV